MRLVYAFLDSPLVEKALNKASARIIGSWPGLNGRYPADGERRTIRFYHLLARLALACQELPPGSNLLVGLEGVRYTMLSDQVEQVACAVAGFVARQRSDFKLCLYPGKGLEPVNKYREILRLSWALSSSTYCEPSLLVDETLELDDEIESLLSGRHSPLAADFFNGCTLRAYCYEVLALSVLSSRLQQECSAIIRLFGCAIRGCDMDRDALELYASWKRATLYDVGDELGDC